MNTFSANILLCTYSCLLYPGYPSLTKCEVWEAGQLTVWFIHISSAKHRTWNIAAVVAVQSLKVSDSLQLHELQHTRLPSPSPTPGACSNSCPLSQWCQPTISSSVTSFSCPQSFSVSRSFPVSQLFASGGQSIGVSALASVLPMNIHDWFPLRFQRPPYTPWGQN